MNRCGEQRRGEKSSGEERRGEEKERKGGKQEEERRGRWDRAGRGELVSTDVHLIDREPPLTPIPMSYY